MARNRGPSGCPRAVLLVEHGPAFGVLDPERDLVLIRPARVDRLGFTQVRFEVHYAGLPVYGAELRVPFDSEGRLYEVHGLALPISDLDPKPTWSGQQVEGVVSDDVIVHEWGHAYTDFTSDLIYAWQTGALNEAYSDIWGEIADQLKGRGLDSPAPPRTDGSCSSLAAGTPADDESYRWGSRFRSLRPRTVPGRRSPRIPSRPPIASRSPRRSTPWSSGCLRLAPSRRCSPPTVPAGQALVVEIVTPDGQSLGNSLFVGSNFNGETGPTFLTAAECGAPVPTPVADLGITNMHMVRSVTGQVGTDFLPCYSPVQVPWLSLSPAAGVLSGGSTTQVTVTLDSSALADGLHEATLCVEGDDPEKPRVEVPVELQVGEATIEIFSDDFESGHTAAWSSTVP